MDSRRVIWNALLEKLSETIYPFLMPKQLFLAVIAKYPILSKKVKIKNIPKIWCFTTPIYVAEIMLLKNPKKKLCSGLNLHRIYTFWCKFIPKISQKFFSLKKSVLNSWIWKYFFWKYFLYQLLKILKISQKFDVLLPIFM